MAARNKARERAGTGPFRRITVYAAMEEQDQTEGRGGRDILAYFTTRALALPWCKGRGVMGGDTSPDACQAYRGPDGTVYVMHGRERFPIVLLDAAGARNLALANEK